MIETEFKLEYQSFMMSLRFFYRGLLIVLKECGMSEVHEKISSSVKILNSWVISHAREKLYSNLSNFPV